LNFLQIQTRPDIAFAVTFCAQGQQRGNDVDAEMVERVIGYLAKNPSWGVVITASNSPHENLSLTALVDSSYASQEFERRSPFGYFILLNGNPVLWRAKASPVVAVSSAEAEYIAISEAVKELKHMLQLLTGLNFKVSLPMCVRTDSQPAMAIAKSIAVNPKTKHIDVRFHFVRDLHREGLIEFEYISTHENTADMLTKHLPANKFEKHRGQFLINLSSGVRG